MVRECSRPVRAWVVRGSAAWRVEPVGSAVPGFVPSLLRRALMASIISGVCWYSSTHTGGTPETARVGFAATASRVAGSSRSLTSTPPKFEGVEVPNLEGLVVRLTEVCDSPHSRWWPTFEVVALPEDVRIEVRGCWHNWPGSRPTVTSLAGERLRQAAGRHRQWWKAGVVDRG